MSENYTIRTMNKEDYDAVHALWMTISGFGIRTIDDSREGICRFIDRNPGISVVAVSGDEIIGTILCGHDGRTATFYHVCVRADMRRQGIGKAMAVAAMRRLQNEHISKISLIAYKRNIIGNQFWNEAGWSIKDDVNTYEFILNEENITNFNA